MLLSNPRCLIASVSSMFAMICMLFYESFYADHLRYEMGVEEAYIGKEYPSIKLIGYFFALLCFTYALSAPFVGFLTKALKRNNVTCFSFFLSTIALFLFGPS